MRDFAKAALGALLPLAAILVGPASADVDAGISFGFAGPGYTFDSCDYYDYYAAPPPWGLPADYCDYPVYFEPVFHDGLWYRGPIYYRWYRGQRLFWLNGGWHANGWRGGPRPGIAWQNRGGWNNGFRPGMRPGPGFRPVPRAWRGLPPNGPWFNRGPGWTGGERPYGGGRGPWTRGVRPYGAGPPPHGGFGGHPGGGEHGHGH